MNKNVTIPQDALDKPCTKYGLTNAFEYAGIEPSIKDYLIRHDYEEIPGNWGPFRYFRTTEHRLAHKYCALLIHQENHLFLLREAQFSEFLMKWAPVAPILPEILPFFDGQVMTKKLV